MIFEEITEDILNEKLITYGNRKPYGQIVFIAGGAGSGKGFAISNFVDSASFKIRDVDEMKKQIQILNRLGKLDIRSILKKYGRNIKLKDLDLIRKIEKDGYKLQNFNLKNPDHVYALHILVKAIGIKDTSLEKLLLGKNNPETLPNILFDITAKDISDITSILPKLKQVGYKPENVHLTWVLTNYVTAMYNNKNRARMVPEDILLKTHEGASNTIWGIITKALPKGMNGRVDVILNNPEHTVFFKDKDGKVINGNVKGFLSLPLKKEKGGIYAEKVWKDKLFNWVKSNAPESITSNMKESVITEKQFKGLDGIDDKTPLTKISDTQKLKIIQSTGNIISFKVPKGSDRNFWQVISKGKIKKTRNPQGYVRYILSGKMINSPFFKSEKDLINGVDWDSVEKARRFNESVKEASFRPNSGTMSGGTYGLDNRKYQLKRDVKGVQIGDYTNVILPKGTIIYNVPGGVFAHQDVLAAYQSGQNKYFNKPTLKGISIKRTKNTIMAIEKNSKILESVNESMFSMIDLIRQDSKDVRDFVKKVFKDKEFKKMSNDKDFIKYLKSIYEGVVEEAQSPAQKAAFQKMLDKKAGKDESKEEEVNEIAKFAGWVAIDHKGKRLEIKKSEAKDLYNAKLLAIKKLKVPKSKESMLVIKPGYNESVVNEANLRLNKKVKSELDAYLKGTKINSPEHQHAIMLILKGALTDANFHSEAKQLPKFFPKAKQSKHVGSAMEDVIEDKGAAYSKAAKWDGHDIIDAFSFYTSMAIGGSFGKKLETLKESISESVVNEANTLADRAASGIFWGSPLGIQLHKQFKGRFNKSKFEKELSDKIEKSKRPESTIKIIGRYLNLNQSKLNSYTSGEIIEDQEFIKDSTKKAEQLYKIFVSSNEAIVNEIDTSVSKRRAGASLKQKLKGKRSDGMGKYTSTIYGLDSNGKRVELKSLNDLNKYSKFELDESIVNEATDIYQLKKIQITKFAGKSEEMVQINAPKYQTAGDHLVMTKKEFIHVLKMSPLLLKQLKEQLKESVVNENDSYSITDDKGRPFLLIVGEEPKDSKGKSEYKKDGFHISSQKGFKGLITAYFKDEKTLKKNIDKKYHNQLGESVNEGLKHNDMYTMLDIAAGYSSTQDQAANQMWSDEQDLYDYLKSDHIPKKYHKKFYNDIKRRFKGVSEGKDDFTARHGKADINLKKGYKHHSEDELTKLYDKVGKLAKDKKIKKVDVIFEAKEDDVITQLRKIVKDKQNALVVDTKSKKKVRVDMQSASLMVQVYDALKQQSNKDKFVKSGIVAMGHMAYKLMKNESVNEAKDEIYFKSYTHAIEAAEVMAGKKGYTIEDDELFNKVGMNSKRPSVGKTTKVNLELLKNGKPQKKMLHIQVYGMKNSYELNAYIN